MEKMKHYQGAAMRLLKALLAAYIVTGGLLLLLALLLYKLRLSESVINLSITAIYLIACFLAGFLMGKMMKTRKYLWGAAGGLLYFTLLPSSPWPPVRAAPKPPASSPPCSSAPPAARSAACSHKHRTSSQTGEPDSPV